MGLEFFGRALTEEVSDLDGASVWRDAAGEVSVHPSAMPWAGDWLAQYAGMGEGFGSTPEAALRALEQDVRGRHERLGRLIGEAWVSRPEASREVVLKDLRIMAEEWADPEDIASAQDAETLLAAVQVLSCQSGT